MGMNNFDALKLIVDIETVPIEDAADYLEEPCAPRNYKDPVKIADYIAQAKQEALSGAGLDADLCRIVAIGWRLEERDRTPHVHLCRNEDQERLALDLFWHECALDGNRVRRLVTFNGLRFDLPVLMRRSLYLDMRAPWLNVDRYRSPHIDLYQRLTFNGAIDGHKLSFYAKRFGLPVDDTHTGADIARMVQEGQWDAVAAHCGSDVNLTHDLAERLHYIHFDEDAYDEAARDEVA